MSKQHPRTVTFVSVVVQPSERCRHRDA